VFNNMSDSELRWVDKANCRDLLFDDDGEVDTSAVSVFFVEAGRVIEPRIQEMCVTCPVRRECLEHSFAGPDGRPVQAGYFAGFSYGQRKAHSLIALLALVERESVQYRTDAASRNTVTSS
jgi:hypothetical protein